MRKLESIALFLNLICSWFIRQSNFDFWNIWNFLINCRIAIFDYDPRPSWVMTGAGRRHKSNDSRWSPAYLYQVKCRSHFVNDKQKNTHRTFMKCVLDYEYHTGLVWASNSHLFFSLFFCVVIIKQNSSTQRIESRNILKLTLAQRSQAHM